MSNVNIKSIFQKIHFCMDKFMTTFCNYFIIHLLNKLIKDLLNKFKDLLNKLNK